MNIAICDSNESDRNILKQLLQPYFEEKGLFCEIVEYRTGANLVYEVEDGEWFDIIFLDTIMDGALGIDVARKLRDMGYCGEIIFVTATKDYAVDSYDVMAAGYIIKPYDYEKLCSTLNRIATKFSTGSFQVRQRSKVTRIPYNEILYVESENSKCILHRMGGEKYTLYKRLGDIEREFADKRFLRCHQSYIVNMDHIEQADRQFILSTGDIVQIRQRDLRTIRQVYTDYINGKENRQLQM